MRRCKLLNLALILPAACAWAQSITGNTPGFIRNASDAGPADPSSVISVTVWLKLHNEQDLDMVVRQQSSKGSPQYQRWLTADQINSAYAPTAQEATAVSRYLAARNLNVTGVDANNYFVTAQGSVADVQKCFGVSIHNFNFQGGTYRANTSDPSVGGAAVGLVSAITGLDNYGMKPMWIRPKGPNGVNFPMTPLPPNPQGIVFQGHCFAGVQNVSLSGGGVQANYRGLRYAPELGGGSGQLPACGFSAAEIQSAYGMPALYAQGLTGAGETIVIVAAFGSPTIQQDVQIFSHAMGLPPADLTVVRSTGLSNVSQPQDPHATDPQIWYTETTLDVEWSHALAPGAKIVLVTTESRAVEEGVHYAVVHHLGNTVSLSWGSAEQFGPPAVVARINRMLQMAAAQGISVQAASGDDGDSTLIYGFPAVTFPASSPFATAVGGTSLALNPDNTAAFQTGWGTNITALGMDSSPLNPPVPVGFIGGSGGGTSVYFAKPPFQSGLPGTYRQLPDIAMVADGLTGMEVIQSFGGQAYIFTLGGTSVSAPMFSGIMAIAAQRAGHGLGAASALLYSLPAGAINDVLPLTSPDNVTGSIQSSAGTVNYTADQLAAPLGNTTSYLSALFGVTFFDPTQGSFWQVVTFGTDGSLVVKPGWDNVTGLGTPNGLAFVNAIGQ